MSSDAIHAKTAYLLTREFSPDSAAAIIPKSDSDFDPADYLTLAKLQAFIIKVKHAAIRRETPCAFRLLSEAGMELQFFGDWAPQYLVARRAGPIPPPRHLLLLSGAFQRFCAAAGAEYAVIADMFEHEFALCSACGVHPSRLRNGAFVFDGLCILTSTCHDLPAIARHDVPLDGVTLERRRYLLYQHTPAMASARVLELDAVSALVARAASDGADLDGIARQLKCADVNMIGAVLAALRDHGLGHPREDLS